jgi:hypothetical protein
MSTERGRPHYAALLVSVTTFLLQDWAYLFSTSFSVNLLNLYAIVHDETWPLLRLFAIGLFRPAEIVKSFSTVTPFLRGGVVNPTPTPNLEDQGISFCLNHHL